MHPLRDVGVRAYRIVDNPAYQGRTPTILKPDCHDRTPFLTIECGRCAQHLHIHEGQLASIPTRSFGTVCPQCSHVILLKMPDIERAFAHMRDRGWIEPKEGNV